MSPISPNRKAGTIFCVTTFQHIDAALWVNNNLRPTDKIYTLWHPLIFPFNVPNYYGHSIQDSRIDARPEGVAAAALAEQFRQQRITHVLTYTADLATSGFTAWRTLAAANCLKFVRCIEVTVFGSRTMRTLGETKEIWGIYALDEQVCDGIAAHPDQIRVKSRS